MVQRMGDLEIDQELRFEKREWIFQKIGRAVMALVIIGALIGYFGAGPLSLTEVQDSSGALTLTYERFGRRGATTTLTLHVDGGVAENGKVDVWVSSDYLDKMQVDSITPTPDQVAAADDGEVYTFLVDEPGDPVTSYLQRYLPVLDRAVEGRPLVILEDGKTKGDRLKKARVEADILEAARKLHGLERLEQLKYAVLERDGSISVVPKAEAAWRATPASQRA